MIHHTVGGPGSLSHPSASDIFQSFLGWKNTRHIQEDTTFFGTLLVGRLRNIHWFNPHDVIICWFGIQNRTDSRSDLDFKSVSSFNPPFLLILSSCLQVQSLGSNETQPPHGFFQHTPPAAPAPQWVRGCGRWGSLPCCACAGCASQLWLVSFFYKPFYMDYPLFILVILMYIYIYYG